MPDAPQSELGARFQAIYKQMRDGDVTVRKFERVIAAELDRIAIAKQQIIVATTAIRSQERWLKKGAAAQVRAEAGIKTIPGFHGPVESATEMRRRINEKFRASSADALANLPARVQ
jgi:hypothetical protein